MEKDFTRVFIDNIQAFHMEQKITKISSEDLRNLISEQAKNIRKKRELLERREVLQKMLNECNCQDKAMEESDLNKSDINVIIPNWQELKDQFNDIKDINYKNPLEIWKELKAKVNSEYGQTGELPIGVTVDCRKDGGESVCTFSLEEFDDKKANYYYTGTAA